MFGQTLMSKQKSKVEIEQFLQIVLNNIPMRVFLKDTHSKFVGSNQIFLEDLGIKTLDGLVGKSDYDFIADTQECEHFIKDDQEVMHSGLAKIGIEEPQSVNGAETRWLRTNKVPLTDKGGQVIGLLGTYEDITEQVKYREEIEQQALIDSLTQLSNRRHLQNCITSFNGECAGLLFIDLDYFKVVNDSLGHSVGDALLQQVAERINAIIPDEKGLVARLGGDEFSIFVPLVTESEYKLIMADFAQQIVDTLVESFIIDSHILNVSASIGIAFIQNGHLNHSQGFREADIAMYFAKENGRNNYQFYNDEMREQAERKNAMQRCMHHAIANNEFHLVYQPQYNEASELIGAEALLRWQSEELGFVPPDEFISIAEQTGLIHSLGQWVFNTALDALLDWNQHIALSEEFKLAVNVSSVQFRSSSVVSEFKSAIESRGLNANNVQIEITESLFIEDKDVAVRSMLKLQQLGMSIAIDDFGTGYSSLSYLANLPIDKLKIDRSFVENLDSSMVNRKLVDTLINMSKNLHMEVIAEGVETSEERDELIGLGCSQFQGYLFSRPVKSDVFIATILKG